jgi:hypothetical protein
VKKVKSEKLMHVDLPQSTREAFGERGTGGVGLWTWTDWTRLGQPKKFTSPRHDRHGSSPNALVGDLAATAVLSSAISISISRLEWLRGEL